MADPQISIRVADRADIAAVDALLGRSYPALLKADYPPSVLVLALPLISKAQLGLVTCGSYYVAEDSAGAVLAAGGWTRAAPPGSGVRVPGEGHIRHVVTDHRLTRRGLGRALLNHIFDQTRGTGIDRLCCLSTRTAVPFYRAMGFVEGAAVQVPLRPGIDFPAVRMIRDMP